MAEEVGQSIILRDKKINHLYSGIDIEAFKPQVDNPNIFHSFGKKKVILGVASIWDRRKGLNDFIKLYDLLPEEEYQIVLVGLKGNQVKQLPAGMLGVYRTESINELAKFYSSATIFVNPTYQDNFPTTNLEALACGTPVITYNTGGSPEAIDHQTGRVVEKGSITGIKKAIFELEKLPWEELKTNCRNRAIKLFNRDDRYLEYLELYKSLVFNDR